MRESSVAYASSVVGSSFKSDYALQTHYPARLVVIIMTEWTEHYRVAKKRIY